MSSWGKFFPIVYNYTTFTLSGQLRDDVALSFITKTIMVLIQAIVLLIWIQLVSSKDISGIFIGFDSLTWNAASDLPSAYQGPQIPTWTAELTWF